MPPNRMKKIMRILNGSFDNLDYPKVFDRLETYFFLGQVLKIKAIGNLVKKDLCHYSLIQLSPKKHAKTISC